MRTRASAVRPANASVEDLSIGTILRIVRGSWSLFLFFHLLNEVVLECVGMRLYQGPWCASSKSLNQFYYIEGNKQQVRFEAKCTIFEVEKALSPKDRSAKYGTYGILTLQGPFVLQQVQHNLYHGYQWQYFLFGQLPWHTLLETNGHPVRKL